MSQSLSVVSIKASADRVWQAITAADLVKKWQYGSELVTTWQVGTPIRFITPWEGQTFEQHGVVLAFEPSAMLSYSLFAPRPGLEDLPENYFVMTYRLGAEANGTRLEIIQDDPRGLPAEPADEESENPVLKSLKELVEQGL